MSVGATALVAITGDRVATRRPVLTLYRNRSSQVGVPCEDVTMDPDTSESRLVIADFVDRVGDRAPVVATDGSTHRAEQLLADGLHALAYAATGGFPLPKEVAVTHPAHWPVTAVDALSSALSRVSEWSQHPVTLISDAVAVLTALQANPGLPANGVIAVCDFGGSGTNITLVDATRANQPIGVTVRHIGLSGRVIDQALLNRVVTDLSVSGSLAGSFAIGSLAGLRSQCRNAKEQLSTNTATELVVDLPGFHGGVSVTRAELDEVIRAPFDSFFTAVQKTLRDRKIQATDLTAAVALGGGANISAITNELAQRLGVVVTSPPRPQLAAAIGAALGVTGGPAPTEGAPPVPPTTEQVATMTPPEHEPSQASRGRTAWYRRPVPVIVGTALVALVMVTAALIGLRHAADSRPVTPAITTEPTATTSEPPASQIPATP
jgi:molecular chaperone DnaK (HSP70)